MREAALDDVVSLRLYIVNPKPGDTTSVGESYMSALRSAYDEPVKLKPQPLTA